MADAKPKKLGFHEEFGWFIWGLVGIGFLWFFTGGPQRDSAHQGAFIKPPAPLDTGETYGNYYTGESSQKKETLHLPPSPLDLLKNARASFGGFFGRSNNEDQIRPTSLLSEYISFDGMAGARSDDPSKEYIRIIADQDAQSSTLISGLLLKGSQKGLNAIIPEAANFPLMGVTVTKSDVLLPPNGRAIISSGRSPIGTSFRANMCTGYLDQFQDYTPKLLQNCPSPRQELEDYGPRNEPACADFVMTLPRCKVFSGPFPSDLSALCKKFVTEKLTYNSCALNHKEDDRFYSNEWRLFLGKESELWGNEEETLTLIDAKGKVIDSLKY